MKEGPIGRRQGRRCGGRRRAVLCGSCNTPQRSCFTVDMSGWLEPPWFRQLEESWHLTGGESGCTFPLCVALAALWLGAKRLTSGFTSQRSSVEVVRANRGPDFHAACEVQIATLLQCGEPIVGICSSAED